MSQSFTPLLQSLTDYTYDKCSQQLSCMNCTGLSGCHYCASDMKCHAQGSIYGCTYGTKCSDISECMRSTSEYIGYKFPSLENILILLSVGCGIIIICMIVSIFIHYLVRKNYIENDDENENVDDTYSLLPNDNTSTQSPNNNNNQRTSDDIVHTQANFVKNNRGTINVDITPNKSHKQSNNQHSDDQLYTIKRWSRCLFCTKFILFITILLVTTLCGLGIFFYPQVPQYSLCTKQVQWSTVLYALATGHLKANVDMHFSIYNPNRFALTIHTMTADFSYQKSHVATATLHDVTFTDGSITDFVLPTIFEPSLTTAMSMYKAHQHGAMNLDLVVSLDSSLLVLKKQMAHLATNATVPNIPTDVPNDLRFCKCNPNPK